MLNHSLSVTRIHFFDKDHSKLTICRPDGGFRVAAISTPVPAAADDFQFLDSLKMLCVTQGLIDPSDEIAMLAS